MEHINDYLEQKSKQRLSVNQSKSSKEKLPSTLGTYLSEGSVAAAQELGPRAFQALGNVATIDKSSLKEKVMPS